MSFVKKSFSSPSSKGYQRMPGYTGSRRRSSDSWKIWLWVALIFLMIPVVVGGSWFWLHIMRDLPDIAEIENYSFKQATTITDRHGEVLYTLFEENRQYIPYEDMSENFVHALVSTEDQRFWTNPGIDWKGTLRAGITDITQGKTHGGSTITQQLIKNLMLTPEKKIERKLKEIVLALRLNTYTRGDIKSKHKGLSSDELDRKVKEKILELYSNYIFLGNNSYGVETASRNYFDKSASDLTILEASILAGIPQAPSRYDPYTNREVLMGGITITDRSGTAVEVSDALQEAVLQEVIQKIQDTDIAFKRDDSAIIDYFRGLLGFQFTYEGSTYQIAYRMGRKDTVLARMYEEGYITESEFKKNFIDAFRYEFKRGSVEIQAPHFVFWVTSLLEENYDPEMLRKGGLTVKTTLDYDIQQLAEESIAENEASNLTAYGADNAALVYINSHDGDVLAYVGSKDYYNDEIDGQVDIIQANRQPGSTVKPFVYALGFMNMALTIDSPIYDIAFSIGANTPANADGDYRGLMAIKNALAYSRNIPAIKMFFSAGGEEKVKPFFKQLGMTSLRDDWSYGYPLSIGAGEVPMLELANAYMHLSAMGKPADINPILEIRASDGSLLYKKQVKTQEQVVPAGVAYLIWDILSTKSNFPASWVNTFSYPGVNFATKSGTTNVKKNGENYPRDGWFAAYTPSSVMLFWGGNTDGRALRKDAFGGWINSPIWKTFTEKLVTGGYIQSENVAQREVKSVSISKITGKLSSFETPLAFVKNSLGYIQTLPQQVDANISKVQVDSLCNGVPNELTPPSDISDAYFISPESIMPDRRDQEGIIERWRKTGLETYSDEVGSPLTLDALTGDCAERYTIAELGEISLSIIQPTPGQTVTRTFSLRHQTKSPFAIKTIKMYLDDIELKSFKYNKKGNLIDISTVTIPEEIVPDTYDLKVIVIDEKGYSDTQTVQITVQDGTTDTTPPYLMENKIKVTKKANERYEVVMLFSDDASTIESGKITQGEETVYEFQTNVAIFELAELGEVSYTISDNAGNTAEGTVILKE